MFENEMTKKPGAQALGAWQKPTIQRVGDVGEVFKMPGGGKLSLQADDSGDSDRKPKGQE